MNDKRTFAFLALALLVCGLLGPFVIRLWGSSELSLGFGVVAEALALIFGVLSYSEKIGKVVTHMVTIIAVVSAAAIAILIPIRQMRSAELQAETIKQTLQTLEAQQVIPSSVPETSDSTLLTALKQDNVTEVISELGGRVETDSKTVGNPVVLVELGNTRVTDEELELVSSLSGLRKLFLHNTKVTDAGLVHLKGLSNLETLTLDSTAVTDAGLAHITGLTRLSGLGLKGTKITDAGLVHLKGMENLESIELGFTQIGDDGLMHLKGATRLRHLHMMPSRMTDAGLNYLSGLIRLEELYLGATQVTDGGLAHLEGLKELRFLSLANTQVTDAGLPRLKALTKLQWLDLEATWATTAFVTDLQKTLPNVRITFDRQE